MRRGIYVTSLALVLAFAGSSRAQGQVPGGWGPQVGYQSFGGSWVVPGTPYGWGAPAVNYPQYGVYQSTVVPTYGFSGYLPPPRVVNNLGPLGAAIGRTTRPRRGR
jgi:hypothetical protein